MLETTDAETVRAAELLAAQGKAETLFAEITRRGLITAGVRESEASDAIRDLAAELFGVSRYWHKRIVRSGENTLHPYRVNPPDRTITDDDVVFCDFGPLFSEWEADYGRTFVLGDDPAKHRLRDALPAVWQDGQRFFDAAADITGQQLYAHVCELAAKAGYEFGGRHAGHLIGEFPHDKIPDDDITCYVTPGSDQPMRRLDSSGRVCHWILEVHLIDRERGFGGFHEELLDLR